MKANAPGMGLLLACAQALRDSPPEGGIAALAQRHRITPRYLQTLFADCGESASACPLNLRLDAARTRLTDPRRAGEQISAVAFACGFGELSTCTPQL